MNDSSNNIMSLENKYNTLSDAYFKLDDDFKILFINQSAEALIKSSIKKVYGKLFWDIIPSLTDHNQNNEFDNIVKKQVPLSLMSYSPEFNKWVRWFFHATNDGISVMAVDITEHAIEKQKIELSEIKLREILDSINDSIILLDINYKVIEFNGRAHDRIYTILNKKIKKGEDFRKFAYDTHQELFISSFEKAISGETVYVEFELITKSTRIWIESKYTPCYDNDKNLIGITISSRDISERKKTELAIIENKNNLKKSESILRAILDNTSESIVLMDINYKVLAFNNIIKEELKNYFNQELFIGADYREFVVESMMPIYLKAFNDAKNGISFSIDAETIKNDIAIWFQYNVRPVYFPDGELLGVSLTAQNIDEKKKIEIALKKSEEKFKKIIDFSSIPMLLINPDMSISMANEEAEKLFGYNSKEFLQKSIYDLKKINPKNHQKNTIKLNYTDLNKNVVRKMYKKNGELILAETSTNIIDIENTLYAILSIQDITERLKNESQLKKYNHELTLLTKINDITLNIDNELELFEKVCKCIVYSGNYKLAWICMNSQTKDEFIKPIASCGETNYLTGLKISLKQEELSKGPTAQTLLHGKTIITNNVNSSKYFKPWLERAHLFGISSSCVIPLIINKKVIGAINVYSETIDSFDQNEVSVLERLSNNISLALTSLRTKNEKIYTANQLNERVKELRTIYSINNLLKDDSSDFNKLLNKSLKIIPLGWKYPELCQAKIIFNNIEYISKGYLAPNAWQISKKKTSDNIELLLEVSYTTNVPNEYEGPFLKEERDLIDTLSELFVSFYDKQLVLKSLKKSEENLKSVFNNTSVGHLLIDENFNIISLNETMRSRFLLLSRVELKTGDNFINQLAPERKAYLDSVFETIQKNKKLYTYNVDYTYKNERQYFTTNINPILKNKKIIGYSISIYDITTIKSLEIEREKIINDLTQRNRDLEQFSYIVSHNIRSPLATILGFSSLLGQNMSESDKAIVLKGMEESAIKLDNTIKDVNEILNIKKELAHSKTIVNLNKIISSVLGSLEKNIIDSGAKIDYNFKEIYIIHSINPYIHSIFYNLISNGLKYSKRNEKPYIEIWSEKKEKHIEIYFKDNGIGIDMQKYGNEIFGLYKKFNFEIEGKGMGLFMVKTQINALNGSIAIKSKLNEGTEFKITIPI